MSIPFDVFTPAQAAVLLGIAALFGASMGSFIDCLAARLVVGESVLKGRSHCAACGHVLGPLDLVPVFSWLALRGRCRHCGVRIGARALVVEAVTAAAFALLVVVHGVGVPTLVYAVLVCVLAGAALVDLDTFTIPNGFIVTGVLLWLVSIWFMRVPPGGAFGTGSMFVPLLGPGWPSVALDGLLGAVVAGGGLLLFSSVFDAVTGRRSLGGGDVKLLFMVGLFLGLAGSLLVILVACVLGLVFAFARGHAASSSADGGHGEGEDGGFRTRAIPFGPSIAAATVLALVAGPSILGWYVGLL